MRERERERERERAFSFTEPKRSGVPAQTGIRLQQAFSLVELSIVLVILGLLVGGVLSGQSLIRAAELRAVTNEYQRYVTATQTFRDKYFALPGDMNNATAFWGIAGGTGSDTTCFDVVSTTAATCNGDGEGRIFTFADNRWSEAYRYWQHLANAGLIEGSYTGRADTATYSWSMVIGKNAPQSKMSAASWAALHTGPAGGALYSGDTAHFDGSYSNTLYFGIVTTFPWGLTLKPEEMWNIDTKMDDGKPAYGKVISYKPAFRANCATTGVSATAEYELTQTSKTCNILFPRAF